MVSIILEDLFEDRSSMRKGRIQAFTAVVEEAHNFVPSKSEEKNESPSLLTIRRLLTEGRKFGTSVILISQRPGRLDETTLAQCNSFLVLKLVNPKDVANTAIFLASDFSHSINGENIIVDTGMSCVQAW